LRKPFTAIRGGSRKGIGGRIVEVIQDSSAGEHPRNLRRKRKESYRGLKMLLE